MRKVYSYIRFSTPEQAKGSSLQRQLDYANKYASENGLCLDESISMRDEGLSAYHQDHIKKGALGVFLRGVENGIIEPGSVLIIEGLDRLSRAEPIQSQALLSQIINAGITVVTASDGKEYNRESLKTNPMDLVYSLLVMIRAHEESSTKSSRVKASIVKQIQKWQENDPNKKTIRNGADPYWCKVRQDKSGFDLIPERVEVIKYIIDLYLKGWGYNRIMNHLNDTGVKPFKGERWYVLYITTVVKNRTLLGERSFKIDGETFIIKN